MAKKQVIVSDLTGAEAEEKDAIQIVVRKGPGIDRPIALDALPSELGDISEAPDIYVVEVRPYDGTQPREMVVALKELKKVAPNGDVEAVLENARSFLGRPRGSRNGS